MKALRNLTKILAVVMVMTLVLSFVACKGSLELEAFTVDRSSVKTVYYIGEEIDFSGIRATVRYSDETLNKEYTRDKNAGINPNIPEHYFPNDDDTKAPVITWRAHATLLFTNWLNYFVYQTTPYDIMKIKATKN